MKAFHIHLDSCHQQSVVFQKSRIPAAGQRDHLPARCQLASAGTAALLEYDTEQMLCLPKPAGCPHAQHESYFRGKWKTANA